MTIVPGDVIFPSDFEHVGRTHELELKWLLLIRLAAIQQKLWILGAEEDLVNNNLTLLTNATSRDTVHAQTLYPIGACGLESK